ncbi:putative HD superfamily hydrolase involved in NAD metabolism [Natranaerovirga pectinivora]|uniref:bis(5'-nucleosyl)-tetraphosphatase (symmetrical) n=1 Tax=Natranaerovirga pectinivora TaxID=682400 RepID=A0A4V2V0A1_9FIRM|nr:bis(5'-nucleosyl)-tetraphosphatase (symmetrical) YqeK [Natranaerovirga pectinivora]TCT14901.1 putative HD superfamily hydrolase involved in NAD metabolism [Natranaerovirga pectinivora]
MKYETHTIKKKLKKDLKMYRYNHSIGVSYTAICLAMKYEYDLKKAEIAGLLHDCGKDLSNNKKLKLCAKNNIDINTIEMNWPDLLHAKVGTVIAQTKYKVEDKEVLDAIQYHTTGRPGMTLLDKIIYVADYIEPNRIQKDLEELRPLAFIDLDLCLIKILKNTIDYLEEKKRPMDSLTKETYDFYLDKLK